MTNSTICSLKNKLTFNNIAISIILFSVLKSNLDINNIFAEEPKTMCQHCDLISNNNSPLDQFEIRNLLSLNMPIIGNISLSITNLGLAITLGSTIVLTLFIISNNYNRLVSNN